jgi:hypothetical protein
MEGSEQVLADHLAIAKYLPITMRSLRPAGEYGRVRAERIRQARNVSDRVFGTVARGRSEERNVASRDWFLISVDWKRPTRFRQIRSFLFFWTIVTIRRRRTSGATPLTSLDRRTALVSDKQRVASWLSP